ncbi:response regulator [bacterium]|nr:response regulator [bacterium]
MRILVVDDDAFSRKLMGLYLKPIGVDLELLAGGQECLDSVSAQPPDLILMDCQMPELDGFETTRRLRQSSFAGIILALTGNSDEETVRRCSEAGMNGHISKPVDAATLRARIAAALPHLQTDSPEAKTPEDPPPPAPAAEDPLARARKIAEAARNPAILARLVGAFIKSAEESMEALEAAAQSLDAPGVAAAAHKLRGSSGSFGAASFSQAAGGLEDALQNQSLQECSSLLDAVRSLWPGLRQYLVNNSGGTTP